MYLLFLTLPISSALRPTPSILDWLISRQVGHSFALLVRKQWRGRGKIRDAWQATSTAAQVRAANITCNLCQKLFELRIHSRTEKTKTPSHLPFLAPLAWVGGDFSVFQLRRALPRARFRNAVIVVMEAWMALALHLYPRHSQS